MSRYRWSASKPLHRSDGEDVHPDDVFEPSAAERQAFGHKMDEAPADAEDDVPAADTADADDDVSAADDGGEPDDAAGEYETYSRDDLELMDYDDLRTLASDGDHPDVDGRSPKAEIIDAYTDSGDD